MTEAATLANALSLEAVAETPATPSTVLVFTVPDIDGEHSFDMAEIPADIRLSMLGTAVRNYIANRVNATTQRHRKDPIEAAWAAYDAAIAADPLQTVVAKPTETRPASPDLLASLQRAIEALKSGELRTKGSEPKKSREKRDPLVAAVTPIVEKAVFARMKEANPKASFLEAKKLVAGDGIAYLNAQIDERVALGDNRAELEKSRDAKYINPARIMLGLDTARGAKDLPSLL